MVENFSRVSRGNGNVYELISDIHWHKEDPWAFALRFHVETLPVGRKASGEKRPLGRREVDAGDGDGG